MIKKLLAGLALTAVAVGAGYASGTATSNEKIKNLEIRNEEIQSALDESEANLVEARLALAQLSVDLDSKNSTIAEKEARISELQEALNNSISSEDVAVLQEQIAALETEVEKLNEDKTELLNLISELQATIDSLEASMYTPLSYFLINDGVITGLSMEGQALYDEGKLTELNIPKSYSLGEDKEVVYERTFEGLWAISEYLMTNTVRYPISIIDNGNVAATFNSFSEFDDEYMDLLDINNPVLRYSFTQKEILTGSDYEITKIGDGAFMTYSSLKKVKLSKNIAVIGDNSFADCEGLETFEIPEGNLTTIGATTFSRCKSLKSIFIPANVSLIKDHAFSECESLTNIKVSANNKTFDSREDCNAIILTGTNVLLQGCASTIVPAGVVEIANQAFSFLNGLTSLTLPDSCIRIGEKAFWSCDNLTEITLSKNLTYIGKSAFQATGLTSVVIPANVTMIESLVFANCKNMTTVTMLGETPPELPYYSTFSDNTTAIYVPADSVEIYKTAKNWTNYANIISAIQVQ